MTKYNFLVYHAQYADFLEKLRNLGILHVAMIEQGSEVYDALRDKYALQLRVGKLNESFDVMLKDSTEELGATIEGLSIERGLELLAEYDALQAEEEVLLQELMTIRREQQRMSVWGDYSPSKVAKLKEAGYVMGFYACQLRNYKEEWTVEYNANVIVDEGNTVYFVTVTPEKIAAIDAEPIPMSDLSTAELAQVVKDKEAVCKSIAEKKKDFAVKNKNNFERFALLMQDDIKIDKVHINTVKAAGNKVMALEGYCPADVCSRLDEMLKAESVYYEVSVPEEFDNVPIKLRNNWFTRLFEPLTGMYGIPSYQEYDPTPILAPFFLLFFAMCMGDSGYGILLILFGLGVKYDKIKMDMFSGMGDIISVLGVGTLVVGFFLGTAFGINLAEAQCVPEVIKNLMITGEVAGFNIQMVLAIVIGVVHICLALIIKAVGQTQRFGFKENISTWGWLLLILGTLVIVVLALGGLVSVDAAEIAFIVVGGVSALGIYIFNNLKRNPLINIGAGLWDTYNMATGLLGDVLSYIRLYALGLAGGMLGGAFNTLGLMILGDEGSLVMWVPFILILFLGHTLNLAMSVLGAFVHPLRLTFVEYFKNSGYEGKGEKYDPLDIKAN